MSDTEFSRNESRNVAAKFAWLLPVGLVVLVLGLSWVTVFVIMNDLVHAAYLQDSTYESTAK
jgi:hypothetical protein